MSNTNNEKEIKTMNEQKYITNPVKAIRANCIDCMGGMVNEVKKCHLEDCNLHPFRMGKNPFRSKREMTDEQKVAMSERGKELAARAKAKREEKENKSDD